MTTGILERVTNLFYGRAAKGSSKNSASEVFDDGDLNSTSEHDDFDIISHKDIPVSETVNNKDVPTPGPVEESDIDEFEIIEGINPPDQEERSILASSYGINESVAEIAGFNKEKLLEMCTFSKMTYGDNNKKLSKAGYKTKREFREEGYTITPFLDSKGQKGQHI